MLMVRKVNFALLYLLNLELIRRKSTQEMLKGQNPVSSRFRNYTKLFPFRGSNG